MHATAKTRLPVHAGAFAVFPAPAADRLSAEVEKDEDLVPAIPFKRHNGLATTRVRELLTDAMSTDGHDQRVMLPGKG